MIKPQLAARTAEGFLRCPRNVIQQAIGFARFCRNTISLQCREAGLPRKLSAAACMLAIAVASAASFDAHADNIEHRQADLELPILVRGKPAAGKRSSAFTHGWEQTEVRHTVYLPSDWLPGKSYPVIVEYPGNGDYRNALGDVSDGTPESCVLGYGLSAGKGFIWICLPFVEVAADGTKRNCRHWWGNVEETKRYCIATVQDACERFGGDKSRVVLCGFSRGAIACNYIGLNDDRIASLWCGFFCHSHYDGVRRWPYSGSDPASAVQRLSRLAGRPQWISHEMDVSETRDFIRRSAVEGSFTFVQIPYMNHSSAWILRKIPERRQARDWLLRVGGHTIPAESAIMEPGSGEPGDAAGSR